MTLPHYCRSRPRRSCKIVGLDQVPTVRLSDMSEAEIRAYVIADNRLAENAGWDRAYAWS